MRRSSAGSRLLLAQRRSARRLCLARRTEAQSRATRSLRRRLRSTGSTGATRAAAMCASLPRALSAACRRDLLVGKRLSEGATSVVFLGRYKDEVRSTRSICARPRLFWHRRTSVRSDPACVRVARRVVHCLRAGPRPVSVAVSAAALTHASALPLVL